VVGGPRTTGPTCWRRLDRRRPGWPDELIEVLRSTGAIREFRPDPVPDDLWRADNARFAEQRQRAGLAWSCRILTRRRLQLTCPAVRLPALGAAGLRPWSPVNATGRPRPSAHHPPAVAEQAAGSRVSLNTSTRSQSLSLYADLGALTAVDNDAERYSFAGGASVYPFA
jgi:hypothetical protein